MDNLLYVLTENTHTIDTCPKCSEFSAPIAKPIITVNNPGGILTLLTYESYGAVSLGDMGPKIRITEHGTDHVPFITDDMSLALQNLNIKPCNAIRIYMNNDVRITVNLCIAAIVWTYSSTGR